MSELLRALLVEDNPSDALLIVDQLESFGYQVQWVRVDTPDDFANAIKEPFDVILCDYSMPEFDALVALEIYNRARCTIPFLVVSGSIGEEIAVEAMRAGAADYLLKDRLGRIGQAVQGCLRLREEERRRRQTELDLLLHRRAIEASSQGFVMADARSPGMPIIYVNSAFTEITGYSAEEVIGRNCRFLQGPKTDPDARATLKAALHEGRSCSVEILNYRKDGSTFWNGLTISPVHDEQGGVTHYVGTQADITEKKSLQEQLLHSQKMEAVGRLAGGIAHDFNNLLTVILGYSQFALSTAESSDYAELIRPIIEAGERASKLTSQLLLFSRKDVVAAEFFDLNTVVNALKKLLERVLGEHVRLKTQTDPRPCWLHADPGQIEQAILNLAINARDAMPHGGEISIQTRFIKADDEKPDALQRVVLTVSDTGCGMTDDVKRKIFEPFFTTKSPEKGTGLGLSIVFGVVKNANGNIEVTTRPGVGSSFEITLPAAAQPENADCSQLDDAAAAPKGAETILVVEDENAVRKFSKAALVALGYRVLEAKDGPTALELSRNYDGEIHLVLSDMVMPKMNGREVVKQITRDRPGIKHLYVTGFTEDAFFAQDPNGGSARVLTKPFTSVTLAKRIREILEEK